MELAPYLNLSLSSSTEILSVTGSDKYEPIFVVLKTVFWVQQYNFTEKPARLFYLRAHNDSAILSRPIGRQLTLLIDM